MPRCPDGVVLVTAQLCRSMTQVEAEDGGNTQTFVLNDEDHTLGASIVDVLNRSPDVVFAGYTVPHPSERKVQLCVQTTGALSPEEAIAIATEQLVNMCETTASLFHSKTEEHKNAMQE